MGNWSAAAGRLIALCAAYALLERVTAGSKYEDGLRWIAGLCAAGVMLDAILLLPGALMGSGG